MSKMVEVLLSFLKIGVIGFGGGSALIPVIEKEVVEEKKWIDDEEFLKHTVISNITPGSLPVKLGALAGYKEAGPLGSLLGAYAVTVPGVLATVLILAMLSFLGSGITHYIEYASVGITLFIVYLLTSYILKVIKTGRQNSLYGAYIGIACISFILTGGKEVRAILSQLLGMEEIKKTFILFDISTIDLMIVTFFMIFYVCLLKSKISAAIGVSVSALYVVAVGKNKWLAEYGYIKNIIIFVMVALCVYSLWKSSQSQKTGSKTKFTMEKPLQKTIIMFLLIPAVLIVFCLILQPMIEGTNTVAKFLTDVGISGVTSFGGGEAYVAVADGFFVSGGYISAEVFYSQVVAVANALPGPILVKIASAIAYLFGNGAKGVLYASLLSTTVLTLCIGLCCSISLVILSGYNTLKDSPALKMLKQYILPVVCGMLISTSINMFAEAMTIIGSTGISVILAFPVMLVCVAGYFALHKKYHFNDAVVIVITAALSLSLFTAAQLLI